MTLAAVAGAHGLAGEVRLKLFAESIASLARHTRLRAGDAMLTLESVRDTPQGPIARFTEITDRTLAEALRGVTLTVSRAQLPPPASGEHYVVDLIGLPATAAGAPIGHVTAIENYGAGDLVEIARPDGARFLVPYARCETGDGALAIDPDFIA